MADRHGRALEVEVGAGETKDLGRPQTGEGEGVRGLVAVTRHGCEDLPRPPGRERLHRRARDAPEGDERGGFRRMWPRSSAWPRAPGLVFV